MRCGEPHNASVGMTFNHAEVTLTFVSKSAINDLPRKSAEIMVNEGISLNLKGLSTAPRHPDMRAQARAPWKRPMHNLIRVYDGKSLAIVVLAIIGMSATAMGWV